MINSIANDGDKRGYDLDLISKVSSSINVPVIAMGGQRVGSPCRWNSICGASAVAGNIFTMSNIALKGKGIYDYKGINCRHSEFYTLNTKRNIQYKI